MSPLAYWLVWVAAVIAGLGIGWALHGAAMERRHDCLPHDPEHCRDGGLQQ